ncbi:ATP-binding protein [Ureibacillus sp. MALMAid1270]|uniref:ATP-binding protein n=1 Tax=Ureibacillus sp. MALMAid1270 TaxID=3411629 RepID=UPI003BA7158E
MVKINSTYKDKFQLVNNPMLVLNTSCQIESLNEQATQLLQLSEYDVLRLDEQSEMVWERLVKQMSQDEFYHCVLNIKLQENFQKFNFVCHFDRKNRLIYARIKKHHSYNSPINKKINQLTSLFKDLNHGLIISTLGGKIIDLNDQASKFLGLEKNQLINNYHDQMFENFYGKHLVSQYSLELSSNGQAQFEISRKVNDCIKWYRIESKVNLKVEHIYTTITDETEKHELKEQLKHQSNLVMIGQMAATVAHEIRNPMTSIKGFIELLNMNLTEENNKYLSIMKSEIERMDQILSEVLTFSKPMERQMDVFSVTKIAKELIEIMNPLANNHNITLQFEVEKPINSMIMGNENRIKQMLMNLVKNAIEEMETGGKITIFLKNVKDKIQVTVCDEGKGIEKEMLAKLFEPFYTTKTAGTGLGLQLVKQVIEEHNGTIHVNSVVNGGTSFVIELPLASESLKQPIISY